MYGRKYIIYKYVFYGKYTNKTDHNNITEIFFLIVKI